MTALPRLAARLVAATRTAPLATVLATIALAALAESVLHSAPEAAAQDAPAPAAPYEKRWESRPFQVVQESSCTYCHENIALAPGQPAREHVTSAHYRAGVTCQDCHGGDPMADEEKDAHSEAKGWLGSLDRAEMMTQCAKCHETETKQFLDSSHNHEYEDVRALTCSDCHTAHTIGAPRVTFSWPAVCAECHVDEGDLPPLPDSLKKMLGSKDETHARLRKLRYALLNRPFPDPIMEPYREVRQLSGDVVHSTRTTNIDGIMGAVVEKNAALREKIDAEIGAGAGH